MFNPVLGSYSQRTQTNAKWYQEWSKKQARQRSGTGSLLNTRQTEHIVLFDRWNTHSFWQKVVTKLLDFSDLSPVHSCWPW